MTLIASISIAAGLADGASFSFSMVSEELRQLRKGDYLHMQATSKPGGAGWLTFVDLHFDPIAHPL